MSNVEEQNQDVNSVTNNKNVGIDFDREDLMSNEAKAAEAAQQAQAALKQNFDALPKELIEYATAKLREQIEATKKNDNEKQSIPLRYAQHIGKDKRYAVTLASADSDEILFYEWVGNYWKSVGQTAGIKLAFDWLVRNAPSKTSSSLAYECHRSSLYSAKQLPKKSKVTIIPFLNTWIYLYENGLLKAHNPNPDVGVIYQIAAHLKEAKPDQAYVPKALPADSMFHKFITTSLPDADVRNLVQEYLGSTFLPDVRFQVAQMWLGDGSNGKSVLLKILTHCHAKVAAIQLDDLKRFGKSQLPNSSLAVAAETPKTGFDVEEFKKCVSGELISIERKNKDAFGYSPMAKWILCANMFPRLNDHTNGIWRRLQVIEWKAQFSGKDIIVDLDKKIVENELDLFVDWCLEGLLRLLKRGDFNVPESVKKHGKDERANNDTVMRFCDDKSVVTTNECTATKLKVYEKYVKYAETNYITPVGDTEFWKRMKSLLPALETKRASGGNRARMVNISYNPDAYDENGNLKKIEEKPRDEKATQ